MITTNLETPTIHKCGMHTEESFQQEGITIQDNDELMHKSSLEVTPSL
jgi:hypothetical protein